MCDSMAESVTDAIRVAAESMGCPELRRLQETAVRAFVNGRDVFVSIPTGGGKSLCYSLLPSVFDILRGKPQSLAIIVSPLVALMKDQVRALSQRMGDAMLRDEMR